jgi:ABC-2 type transport system permease protein
MTWGNVKAVIRREYVQRVRSRWFIFSTIGAPIFMALMVGVPIAMASRTERGDRTIVVVDATGVLSDRLMPDLEDGGWSPRLEPWRSGLVDELSSQVEGGDLGGFVVLDSLTLRTGEATFYTGGSPSPLRRLTLATAVSRAALGHTLETSGVDAEAMLRAGGSLDVEVLSGAGASTSDPQFAIAYGGAFFLYIVILIYSVAVMRATLEEKTNRIVEVVISSMEPWQLMLGKILGVGAVGLTQMAVWIASGTLLASMGIPTLMSARPDLAGLAQLRDVLPGVGMMALFVCFFLGGFFMFSGLYATVGAMCSTDEEAQQAQFPLIIFIVVPILMVMSVIRNPTTPMATGLSLFPLFTPILMWARVAGGGAPPWQVALSFVLMALAVVGIAWVAGRIYKVGILMTGKRPTLPELVRWVREA